MKTGNVTIYRAKAKCLGGISTVLFTLKLRSSILKEMQQI